MAVFAVVESAMSWHPLFTECEFLALLVVSQGRLGLNFHVDYETAPGCFGDERDRPGEVAGPQEVVVAGLTPLCPVLQRRADRLGGQAPPHRSLRRAGVHDRSANATALE